MTCFLGQGGHRSHHSGLRDHPHMASTLGARLPDGDSQILRLFVVWPFGSKGFYRISVWPNADEEWGSKNQNVIRCHMWTVPNDNKERDRRGVALRGNMSGSERIGSKNDFSNIAPTVLKNSTIT